MARSISARFSPLVEPAHLPLLGLLHNSFMLALPSSTDKTSAPSVCALSDPGGIVVIRALLGLTALDDAIEWWPWPDRFDDVDLFGRPCWSILGPPIEPFQSAFLTAPQRAATPGRRKTETA